MLAITINWRYSPISHKTKTYVWGTLHIRLNGAKLCIYDAAPDALKKRCLAVHPFPLKEPVVALKPEFQPAFTKIGWLQSFLRWLRAPVQAESTMS